MLYKRFISQLWKLSLGKKKGLQVLYSQPFSSVIRIVLYVLRFPAARTAHLHILNVGLERKVALTESLNSKTDIFP